MNDTSLMYVPYGLEDVLSPDRHFIFLDWFVFAENTPAQVIRAIPCILHIDAVVLVSLCIMERPHNIWVIHLSVNETFPLRECHSKVRNANFIFLSGLQYNILETRKNLVY